MSFYNRLVAQMVATLVDTGGFSHPLDVVPMGGLFIAQATLSGAGTTAILAAPPAGSQWRLHRFIESGAVNGVLLQGTLTGFLYGASDGLADNLMGQLVGEALQITSSNAGTSYLTYDQVATPNIA